MTKDLFREVLDGKIPVPRRRTEITWPITLLEGQVEYISLVTGLPLEEARAFANKMLALPDLRPATPAFLLTKRQTALAAKAARGTGPRASASWRGNERSTKYRSQ